MPGLKIPPRGVRLLINSFPTLKKEGIFIFFYLEKKLKLSDKSKFPNFNKD